MSIARLLETIGGFNGFGPSAVHVQTNRSGTLELARYRKDVRQMLREHCPAEPGVYGLVDKRARLIYVGYSRRVQKRLLSYFTGRGRGQKEHRIARHAVQVHWETAGHDFPAQLRELELIQRFAPDFNVKGRQRSREPGFVYLTGGAAPQFRFSIRVPSNARRVWGPLPNYKSLRRGVEQLNLMLKLRDCPSQVAMQFAEQGRMFDRQAAPQCLRGEIGTCLAPCAGGCTRRRYHAEARRGAALLDGADTSPLTQLETEMQSASVQMQFERAARLRDAYDAISDVCRQMEQLRQPPEPREGVYEVETAGRRLWYLLGDGLLWGMHPAPESVPEARTALEAIRRVGGVSTEPLSAMTRDSRRLVRSWFRNRPEELAAVRPLEEAAEVCKGLLRPPRRRRISGVKAVLE
ncbi:MAG: UvrB/UvrC motif-containing protein [Planctomycetaceae bacterium]|nr:UvrB/UvrC motif-containing protein [Planctomycetaceae bacterium]